MALSNDPETSIPALEDFVHNTTTETNSGWSLDVVALTQRYKQVQDFASLIDIGQAFLNEVEPSQRKSLEIAFYIGLIGSGELDRAFDYLRSKFENEADPIFLVDLRYLYALSVRLSESEFAERVEAEIIHRTGEAYVPAPLPAFDGDMLDNLIARDTGTRYQMVLVKWPKPEYPRAGLRRRLDGNCEVTFNVSTDGKPKNIKAECSDDIFINSAKKAMKGVRYEPLTIDGVVYEMTEITYPLEYTIG